ncbi:hypothetical protein BH24DEI1_BH24DEI1_08570 [soil metagenome]
MTDVPIIPRETFFGNPRYVSPQLSPDGKRLAYLAPEDGVMNLWLRIVGEEDDRTLTRDRGRGIQFYLWAKNGEQLLYIQDRDGDENWPLYAVGHSGDEPATSRPSRACKRSPLPPPTTFPTSFWWA